MLSSDTTRSRCLRLLLLIAASTPIVYWYGETLPSHNEIETWIPDDSERRNEYNRFKDYFGAEEFVLIGLSTRQFDAELIEAVCCRVESLNSIRACWSPARLTALMSDMDVPDDQIADRQRRLTVSRDGQLAGVIAILNQDGLADRAGTVASIRSVLDYCQLPQEDVFLAGSPVVVAELDRLGSRGNNLVFFGAACTISFLLLLAVIRHLKAAGIVFALTLWGIEATLAILHLFGGEMNFILSALPVMVMVFTLTIAVHFVHYYREALEADNPIRTALRDAMWPCCLATLTTVIGLVSLATSDMRPVRLFGYSAAVGCCVALVTGLFLTPAALVLYPLSPTRDSRTSRWSSNVANYLLRHSRGLATVAFALVAVTAVGLTHLKSNIDPLEFLPRDSKVLSDVLLLQDKLANTSTIEAVVDFRDDDLKFAEKLAAVRQFENRLTDHPAVADTISIGTFLPLDLPNSPLEAARLLGRAQGSSNKHVYLGANENLWRVSARLAPGVETPAPALIEELQPASDGLTVRYTGVAPLLEFAQRQIFVGFWKSFTTAFAIITLVMMLSLRSFSSGLCAMIPNLTPICIVFGILGWMGVPLDIGTMMTASIALGLAVDGTFHFLVAYHRSFNEDSDSKRATLFALRRTGVPDFSGGLHFRTRNAGFDPQQLSPNCEVRGSDDITAVCSTDWRSGPAAGDPVSAWTPSNSDRCRIEPGFRVPAAASSTSDPGICGARQRPPAGLLTQR